MKEPEDDAIITIVNPSFPSNTYVYRTAPGECFVVDPGLDGALVEQRLEELGLTPRFVFCTHGHFDHVGSAAPLQKKYGARVFLHQNDVKLLRSANFLMMAFKLPHTIEQPSVEQVGDDFSIDVNGTELRFHSTPGHTAGSCLIEYGRTIFTGDTLYSRGVGLSRLPGEDFTMLRKSLRSIWNRFGDATHAYPGHGGSAEVGWIKQHNQALLDFMNARELHQSDV